MILRVRLKIKYTATVGLQIDNRQIENLQIDNQNLQIDNLNKTFFRAFSDMYTVQCTVQYNGGFTEQYI